MTIAIVQGTRPEIIKNYSIVKSLCQQCIPYEVLHTNQHNNDPMCRHIYDEMDYAPDRVFPGQYKLGAVIDWLQSIYKRDRITHVIVNGDTAASLAGAIAAMYLDIKVSHMEAGLRSRDNFMYEERNRIMVDSIASLLFAYTEYDRNLLINSSDIRGKVLFEGNTTVDVLHDFRDRIGIAPTTNRYIFVTLHRKEFTDSEERMRRIFSILSELADSFCTVFFSMHPRTKKAIQKHRIEPRLLGDVQILDPLTPFDSFSYQKHASIILTDSGSMQEEAYLFGVPCITIRENTERHMTVLNGANHVCGFNRSTILHNVKKALATTDRDWPDIYGKPGAGMRIANHIIEMNYTRFGVYGSDTSIPMLEY